MNSEWSCDTEYIKYIQIENSYFKLQYVTLFLLLLFGLL